MEIEFQYEYIKV